jgi:hypothetical protein
MQRVSTLVMSAGIPAVSVPHGLAWLSKDDSVLMVLCRNSKNIRDVYYGTCPAPTSAPTVAPTRFPTRTPSSSPTRAPTVALAKFSELALENTPSTCQVDLDCPSTFHVCLKGVCSVEAKACVSQCSQRGTCEYVSIFNPNMSIAHCSVIDSDCKAMCSCEEGFYGSACEFLMLLLTKLCG